MTILCPTVLWGLLHDTWACKQWCCQCGSLWVRLFLFGAKAAFSRLASDYSKKSILAINCNLKFRGKPNVIGEMSERQYDDYKFLGLDKKGSINSTLGGQNICKT